MGGMLVPLGDALVGEQLAQLGMLVAHVTFPSCLTVLLGFGRPLPGRAG
jgi:hypothetical protein